MNKLIYRLFFAGGMILFFQDNVAAQIHNGNLHGTVTHNPNGSAITRDNGSQTAAKTTAQEKNMPQHIYTQMEIVKFVEDVVGNTLRKTHEAGVETGLPKRFNYNIRQWTQQDVTDFAKCDKTFDFFENLAGVAGGAIEKDKNGNYTKHALESQEALTYLKPDGCKSWKSFFNMISTAGAETKEIRAEYWRKINERKNGGKKHGAIIDISEFSDIAVTDDKVKAIDPKAAFAAAGGVMSPEQAKFDEKANAALAKLKAEQGITRAA